MSYISFDRNQLINLEFSLQRELLRTNRAGAYSSTTIINCNTRKYHGLMVSLQPQIDHQHHVLLSTLDATIVQNEKEFNLGIHKYQGDVFEPGGHKYIREFSADPTPKLTYRVGGVVLTCETIFSEKEDRILIKYTLLDAHSPTKLKFKPLLAFRNVHFLSKANEYVNKSFEKIRNGCKYTMYNNYSPIFIQFSKNNSYSHQPSWYYGIEYSKEQTRGYDFKEDLYCPGVFEMDIAKGESIIFSAGLSDAGNRKLYPLFEKVITTRIPRDNFIHCLNNSASQFIIDNEERTDLIAGYHWFHVHGRDSFIALPGLTLPQKKNTLFLKVIDSLVSQMQDIFFPDSVADKDNRYHSVDTQLWFFWTLQQYIAFTGRYKIIWEKYGELMARILQVYKNGTSFNIYMQENGLLYAGNENDSLTWMNTRIDGKPVINRNGLAVEVNVLWYNAIKFYISLAEKMKSKEGIDEWKKITEKIEASFTETFWDKKAGYLADVVRNEYKDFAVRPNQLFVASLPFSPVNDEIKYQVLQKVKQELLTPKGVRTLSPKNPDYHGIYKGNIIQRDLAFHQGSAFPWLFGHFAEGYLKIHRKSGLIFLKQMFSEFEKEMTEAGIGTVSEVFYGDPPHKAKGSISHAWSVAELLRINYLLNEFEKNTNHNE